MAMVYLTEGSSRHSCCMTGNNSMVEEDGCSSTHQHALAAQIRTNMAALAAKMLPFLTLSNRVSPSGMSIDLLVDPLDLIVKQDRTSFLKLCLVFGLMTCL